MAAPHDANIGGVERVQRKKKVVVRKPKAPPMPVPSMEATLLIPHTQLHPTPPRTALQRSVVYKPPPGPPPPPHGGHVPIVFQKESALDLSLPAKPGSVRDRQIKVYNQQTEKQRRIDARAERAARDARKAHVRSLPPEARKFIGSDKLHEYVRTGAVQRSVGVGDVVGAVGKGILHGVEGLPAHAQAAVADFTSRLSAGAAGRPHSEIRPEDSPIVSALSDTLVGPNLVKAMRGESYDPKWAIAEMGLLAVPIKGLPTPLTALLRGVVGAERLARAGKEGLTVANVLEEVTKPIGEVKAARRASLYEAARAANAAGGNEPIPSSWFAGKLAGKGNGPIARAIRNDVRATRKFKVGDLTVEAPADLSRSGKLGRKVLDTIRDSRVVPLRSNETLAMRQLGKSAAQKLNRAAGLEHALDAALPRSWRKMDWPGIYAVRTVGKGVPIQDAIDTTARLVEEAAARGDTIGEQANRMHLALFQKAAKYVTEDANGNPVFRPDAPPQLHELMDAINRTSGERQKILGGMDMLTEDTIRGRIENEQLFYANALRVPTNDFIEQALAANPIRQKVAEIWRAHNPAQAEHGLTIIDAQARQIYHNAVAHYDEEIARAQRAIARNPGAPQNARHQRDIARWTQERDALVPDAFYNEVKDVADALPPEIAAKISSDYGTQGTDWRFSIYDSEDAVKAASRRIADDIIAEGLPLPAEWDTPEKIHEGIHEVFKMARDGESGKDWYPQAAEGIMRVSDALGVEPKVVAQLFAIYSQAADTIANSTFVFRAIREYQKYGDLFVGRFPTRQSEEALKVLQGGTWEGRKRSSFYANILRHIPGLEDEYAQVIKEMAEKRGAPITHPVTVDRWVVRMFRPDAAKDTPEKFYDTFETIIQKMADHVGWEPEQIQAAAWVTAKQRGFEKEIAEAGGRVKGTLSARLAAGSGDAFHYGIEKNLATLDEPLSEVTPQMNRLANIANKKWGGFTVGRDLKPVAPRGYSVSYSLTEREFKLHGLKGEDIARFRDDYAGLLKDRKNKIGGFSDDQNEFGDGTDKTLLSVTRTFQNKDEALAFAREQGQETVYEYKTGNGIRTGLTREQQQEIIQNLDDAHLMGGPRGSVVKPTAQEEAYNAFLDKAAVETGHAKAGRPVSPSQRARTEEWLSKYGERYQEEPLIQEWYSLTEKLPGDEPWWMQEPPPSPEAARFQRETADAQLHYSLFGENGETLPGAEQVLQGKGAVKAAEMPGYQEAVAALARQEIPTDFIESVAKSSLHIYDKTAIGRHLDSLAGGALKTRDWSGIPGAKRMFPDVMTLAGLWEANSRGLYFSKEAHPVDWIHEWTHALETSDMMTPKVKDTIWRHVGAEPGAKLTHDQSEDMADMISAVILGHDPSKTELPKAVSDALLSIQKAMKTEKAKPGGRGFGREHAALEKLPEEERIFLEDIFTFPEEEGVRFTGGFNPKPGAYIPEKPGLPFGTINPLAPRRTATLWNRMLGGKKVVNITPTDAHLKHQWKGELIRSGRWEKSVINGPLEGLLKAYQIERMKAVHGKMIEIGWTQPTEEYGLRDWVMVPVDPKGWTEKTRAQARDILDLLKAFDTGDTITSVQLGKVDAQAIEQVKDFMFPGLTDDSSARITDLVKQAMAKPIDGVFWVPRPMLMKTGLFDAPLVPGLFDHGAARAVVYGVDTLNNIMKMMVLSANPAYYPMNIAGQNIMLLSQLGFTAPFSLARSLAQSKRLDDETLALVDRFSGIGFAGSQFLTEVGAAKRATNAIGKVGTVLIDKYPRRMSFLHEARRLGYKTDEQVKALVSDLSHFDDLMTVHERTQRAMVDYGGLNRFEKGVATHLIFVYPWLKGSTRYALQFPFDHPFQAAMFGGLIYWQQNRLQEALPKGHPGFMKWYLPLDIPKNGENPYGFRMDQLATPLQTLDIAAMMTDWGSGGHLELPWGSNEENMASMLGPLAEEIEKTVSGYDSFTRQQVSRGIPDLFLRILNPEERYATWAKMNKVLQHQTHKGLYDTTQTQNWLRLFLGSLAPISVDVGKAGDMSGGVGTVSPKQSRDKYIAKVEEVNGAPLPPEVKAQIETWKTNDQAYRKVARKYRDEHEIEGDSTIQERAAMLLLTVAEIKPDVADEAKRRAELALHASDDEAQAAYDELRQALGLTQLSTLDGRVRKAQLAQRSTP